MSGMIDALSSKDSSIESLTADDISWMASSINILCVLGFLLTGVLTELLGRRKAISIVSLPATACWVIIYFTHDKTVLLLTRIVIGVCFGGILVLVYISIAEYRPPQIRPLSITLIACVGSIVGTAFGHVLSILMNWRHVALIGAIPFGLSFILPFFWMESPAWLASKGRFEESKASFNALHIQSEASDNELRLLLAYERKKRREMSMNAPKVLYGRKIWVAVRKTYFWKISLLSTVICIYRVASGRILFSTLAITMLQDITGTSDILFFTVVVDGLCILGSVLSGYFLSRFKIRGLLFISGVIANVLMVILAVCLYFLPNNDPCASWAKVAILSAYFVTCLAGPYPVLDTVLSEIFPVDIKSFFLSAMGLISGTLQFSSIKLVPAMLAVMGYHGIFCFNAAIIFLCLLYLWYNLPETKGRSLHEIEYYFKNNTFNYNKELFTSEQNELLNK
ncbi:facilitated trehalose transporter Tret1 [Bicyclus anynana]|uniref:Facilitated trehalose transporter Tret1 n=1 Tax=Bicyclus anynana TaxID=110368 RepID=A0A6J1N6I6_BICAN|nr:facilitated trehalose transporter Tret1 [Bicyclus anynana]